MNIPTIIPGVDSLEMKDGFFDLSVKITLEANGRAAEGSGKLLEEYLKSSGISLSENGENRIVLTVREESVYDEAGFCDESYGITVSPKEILLEGTTKEGLARAVQSLRQLLSDRIPCCRIEDTPRFRWRGIHLDVARHFFKVEEVKRFIDLISLYRYNRLHLHLTEDQGWRIEIKKYPLLTEKGSVRKESMVGHYNSGPRKGDKKEYGGFYTQDELRQIVEYAAAREIVIIPEIDMPGHMQAAISAYPELGCTGHPVDVRVMWGISQDILNVEKSTISFMKDILKEVLEIFPGKFIHIGGDEVPKYQWESSMRVQERMAEEGVKNEEEMQSWFIRQMDDFITASGRRTIGWDEILEGGLADNAAVMSWRGEEGGIKAAQLKHDVVMTPWSHTYFDHYQDLPEEEEPLAIGGFVPVSKVYSYEPEPKELTEEQKKHVLGSQGQLWSEYIPGMKHLEYMAFPRACALAEVLWMSKEKKDYKGFLKRLVKHRKLLEAMGVNAHPRP